MLWNVEESKPRASLKIQVSYEWCRVLYISTCFAPDILSGQCCSSNVCSVSYLSYHSISLHMTLSDVWKPSTFAPPDLRALLPPVVIGVMMWHYRRCDSYRRQLYPGLRRLLETPPLYVVDNFFTALECDALMALAGNYMVVSPVVGAGAGEVSESRTSSSCFLAREDLPTVCSKVCSCCFDVRGTV